MQTAYISPVMRDITIQYSTVQYSTVQYSTVQYSTVQYCIHITSNDDNNTAVTDYLEMLLSPRSIKTTCKPLRLHEKYAEWRLEMLKETKLIEIHL